LHPGEVMVSMNSMCYFWCDEQGQDLIEYTLLMAFVAIAVVGLFAGAGGSVKGVWAVTNNELTQANIRAS
jgi:Flp pilus assembly pilin Flp